MRSPTSTRTCSIQPARQFALTLLAFEIGALGLVAWLVGAIAPWYDRAHSLLWLGFWLAGILLIGAGMCLEGWLSHRRELRADALAAKLLGDAGPVLAMLKDSCAKHERLGRAARLSALLTHPSPTRRRTALLADPRGKHDDRGSAPQDRLYEAQGTKAG